MITKKINKFLSLKLKNDETYIYVNDREILVCKHIAIDMSLEQLQQLNYNEKVNSIDKLIEFYGSTEKQRNMDQKITPQEEFLVHCSNIQAWAEQEYDTKLLHSNISFPLLKRLTEAGDLKAKKVFKEEIVKRYNSGFEKVQHYLAREGYLNLLSNLERELLFKEYLSEVKEIEGVLKKRLDIVGNVKLRPGIELKDGKVSGLRMQCSLMEKKKEILEKRLINIPLQISRLKSLKKLILGSFLDTHLPEWIGNLTEIRHLDLHFNQLKSLPDSLGNLVELNYLNLSRNDLKSLPLSISKLQNLRKLYLNFNKFKELPKVVCSMKNLTDLSFVGNSITKLPSEIKNLKFLRKINMTSNPIISFPKELFNLPKIRLIILLNGCVKLEEDTIEEIKKRKIKVFL
jgi:hypothetical protein